MGKHSSYSFSNNLLNLYISNVNGNTNTFKRNLMFLFFLPLVCAIQFKVEVWNIFWTQVYVICNFLWYFIFVWCRRAIRTYLDLANISCLPILDICAGYKKLRIWMVKKALNLDLAVSKNFSTTYYSLCLNQYLQWMLLQMHQNKQSRQNANNAESTSVVKSFQILTRRNS